MPQVRQQSWDDLVLVTSWQCIPFSHPPNRGQIPLWTLPVESFSAGSNDYRIIRKDEPMSWRGRPSEIGESYNCPHCAAQGIRKPNACKQHRYAYRIWFEMLVWCIRSSVVNKWVLYANPFLRFEQESGFLSFRKPSNNMVNYGYRTLGKYAWDSRDRINPGRR